MASLTQFELLLPELRAYARSICDPHHSAEDLVQDAIERALKSPNTPDRLAELRPWMFRIIRNLQYDELRKLRIRREYLASEKRQSAEQRNVPDHARHVMIRLGFERLPAEKREVLFLVDIMGLSYSEAAEIMDVKKGTVMSRLSRARQTLREFVGRGDGSADDGLLRKDRG